MDSTRCTTLAEVRTFCESVSESATQNIILLKAIEQTVDWLVRIQNSAIADSRFADSATETLKTCERINPIDVDGTLCALIEETEHNLDRLHQLLVSKREAGRNAPELQGEHKETVVDEYTKAIEAIADLHNLMSDLRWAVGEHDADLEKTAGPSFTSPDELRAYLKTI